jgi:arginyl-tRNA synthetase
VVGSEQNAHFRQLFKVLELLGYDWAKRCHHLSYGMVYLPTGKMKSREGTVVDADDFIANMIDLAKVEVRKRTEDLPEGEVEARARLIGLGALKFYMLKIDHHHDIYYDPKESLSFEGETGPYVQYAHARICSVLKKYGKAVASKKADLSLLTHEHERRLITLLGDFPQKVEEAAEHLRPSTIARYLLDLAQAFNEFYHACPILQEEEKLKQARLVMISCVKTVIHRGLHLLGIESPEAM